jgi:hypothetical protein
MWYRGLRRREPGYASHLDPSIRRNQPSSWFQLVKIWVTSFNFARVGPFSFPALPWVSRF